MNNYSFFSDAIQDLDEICEYVARSNPKAASKLLMRFVKGVIPILCEAA